MAELFHVDVAAMAEWTDWVKGLPDDVRKIYERFFPNRLYRLKSTGQRGTVYSVSENKTVTMSFPLEFNPLSVIPLRVFGIDPDDIEECDDLRTGLESLEPLTPSSQSETGGTKPCGI